jgi:hypothetical protein
MEQFPTIRISLLPPAFSNIVQSRSLNEVLRKPAEALRDIFLPGIHTVPTPNI